MMSPRSAWTPVPLIGQSRTSAPCGSRRPRNASLSWSRRVLISMTVVPLRTPRARPSGPSVTASSAADDGRSSKTISTRSATSRAEAAWRPPAAANASVRAWSMSWPITATPARRRFRAIAPPITPSPTMPTRSTGAAVGSASGDCATAASHDVREPGRPVVLRRSRDRPHRLSIELAVEQTAGRRGVRQLDVEDPVEVGREAAHVRTRRNPHYLVRFLEAAGGVEGPLLRHGGRIIGPDEHRDVPDVAATRQRRSVVLPVDAGGELVRRHESVEVRGGVVNWIDAVGVVPSPVVEIEVERHVEIGGRRFRRPPARSPVPGSHVSQRLGPAEKVGPVIASPDIPALHTEVGQALEHLDLLFGGGRVPEHPQHRVSQRHFPILGRDATATQLGTLLSA